MSDQSERVVLLPCPFCGGEKLLTTTNAFGGFCLTCENCDAVGPPSDYDPQQMREAWNTRADAALAEMGKPAPVSVREAARLTDGQLVARCADAWEQAPVGSTWEHRKGGVYVVKGVAVTSDDLTPVVVYQKTTGYGPAFTRPAAEFLDGRFRAIAEGKE